MKWIITIPAILLFALAGCGKDKQSTNELITVDVTASYPKKELILQDFMDVEYIPLETKDDFICQGLVLAIGKDIILARNRVRDGDIFVLDHFSRKISVYDLDGDFKRSLKRGDELYFFHLYNFNQTSLITNNYWVTDKPAFTIISK